MFSIWTDRTPKESATFMDLSVGKYKTVKMAIVHLANERDVYLNFNTESTALCLESLGQLWNLVVLELRETETNYEAGFQDLDRMENCKIPIKVVSVLRRNAMTNAEAKATENPLISEIDKQLLDCNGIGPKRLKNFGDAMKNLLKAQTLIPVPEGKSGILLGKKEKARRKNLIHLEKLQLVENK